MKTKAKNRFCRMFCMTERDSRRAHSPLRPAADAVVLDTTALGLDAVVDAMEREARARLAGVP